MNYLSCYKYLAEDDQANGGVGQGGGNWHTEIAGIKIQEAIAAELGADLTLSARLHGSRSFNGGDYDVPEGHFDVAYLQLFEAPKRRPADFLWSFVSDYVLMEAALETWLTRVKPNLLIALQYPLIPPRRLPTIKFEVLLPNLVQQCARHECRVVHLPWFNAENEPMYDGDKTLTAMCTGKMSDSYPTRTAIHQMLAALDRKDIVLSGGRTSAQFKLSDAEYRHALSTTRYYFSGGIHDFQIPPKYFEVCNYGACLVSPDMPMMRECGFVDGETYIRLRHPAQIERILGDTTSWHDIGRAGRKLVQERHTLDVRAKQIAGLIREVYG